MDPTSVRPIAENHLAQENFQIVIRPNRGAVCLVGWFSRKTEEEEERKLAQERKASLLTIGQATVLHPFAQLGDADADADQRVQFSTAKRFCVEEKEERKNMMTMSELLWSTRPHACSAISSLLEVRLGEVRPWD
ncbi:hypothetical protein B296_00020544 [Ensete ventricosum]|uniref:Uncharacterized protein n=1 Tax=Ensete ventricosum TaxID=4639 RepID=A0A427ASS8_ENSVE|nr:hypothetical protein B296_00020544 [Ensete ventricosum]